MDLSSIGIGKKKGETSEEAALRVERAAEIHGETTVVDGHHGMLFDVAHHAKNVGEESDDHVDLPKLKQAGVRLSILSAFPADRNYPIRGIRSGLEYIDAYKSLAGIPGVALCMNSEDVEEAKRLDKLGFMLGFEGGEFLEGSIEALRMFAKQGLRLLTLTWSERNALGDGAAESGTRGGLTLFGKKVVKECANLGVIVDAAHISEAGFWDVADNTSEPFVASHANCHALYPHPRNLTDDQMKAVAESGGVIGITFNPEYMAAEAPQGADEAFDPKEEGPDVAGVTQVTVETVCDHVIHAIEVAGEDAVAIGSDLDTFTGYAPISGIHELPLLTAELLKRGVTGSKLHGILGGNWLRVIRAVCK